MKVFKYIKRISLDSPGRPWSTWKLRDYDLIDEEKPSPLPLVLDFSSLSFTFAPSSPNPSSIPLAPLFLLLIHFLSLPLSQNVFVK